MDSSFTWQLVILVILIALSSFFSAAETALMSLNKIRIRHLVDENIKGAKLLEKLTNDPNKLLGSILIGNNIVNIGASALASSLAMKLFGDSGVALATGVMTVLVLIFGEITPKTIAKQKSEQISLRIIKIINIVVKVLTPLVFVFTQISQVFIKLLGAEPDVNESFITQEELKTMVGVSEEEGVLEEEEKEMIFNVFEFGDLQVKDVMIQRVDIVAVNVDVTYDEILDVIKQEQFSRIPVYNETIDDIVGVLNIKDLLFISDEDKKNFDIKKFMRDPFYTFEFKKVMELFAEMKKSRNHISIVLDEYGGTVGIATIEDLVEEVVGEIEDEYDQEEKEIQCINEKEYMLEGSTRLHDIKDIIGLDLESDEFDSIGGLIIGELGRFPEEKEEVTYNNIKFIVEEVDKNRIKKVRMFI
ncbi:HlyC/CorC family transporter [Inconstantimicrobium porci]|uniref:HlyC/CorC family transporter n=1 Tax=Inconstantimicrobium porci TaxID=2652291 RepID=A0A7X2T204_9CLOT|nr:hemolysin family protein [Inconstantimicrobium porci]MSR92266.1 HlyC/CorC family transporter [Inconstantimicrobium porci]